MERIAIDRPWFISRLAELGMSQRALARRLGIDATALSHTLAGRRRMTMAEAAEIALIFSVSLEEVVQRSAAAPPGMSRQVKLIGHIGGDGRATLLDHDAMTDTLMPPFGVPEDSVALQFRTAGAGGLECFDGWLCFLRRPINAVLPEAIHRLCYATTVDGAAGLWFVRRGYKARSFTLLSPAGLTIHDQDLVLASPILMMHPAN